MKDSEGSNCGTTDRQGRIIEISLKENETDDQLESTILHEIIHAILYASGNHALINDEDKEESIVLALEYGLHQLYKRRHG